MHPRNDRASPKKIRGAKKDTGLSFVVRISARRTKGRESVSIFVGLSRLSVDSYLSPPPRGYRRNLHRNAKVSFSGGQRTPVDHCEIPDCDSSFGNLPVSPFHEATRFANKGTKCRLSHRRLIYREEPGTVCRHAGEQESGGIKMEYGKGKNKIYTILPVSNGNRHIYVRDEIKYKYAAFI